MHVYIYIYTGSAATRSVSRPPAQSEYDYIYIYIYYEAYRARPASGATGHSAAPLSGCDPIPVYIYTSMINVLGSARRPRQAHVSQ
jgi:hypothetical protein